MPHLGLYTLNENHEPQPEPNALKWALWFERAKRHVARTELADGAVCISTVFLGTDYNFTGEGPPVLFETMVFGGFYDQHQRRAHTYAEAMAMHNTVVALVEATLPEVHP